MPAWILHSQLPISGLIHSSSMLHGTSLFAQAETTTAPSAGGDAGPRPDPPGGGYLQIGMIAVMFAVFYFFILRPQSKRAKEHAAFQSELKPGDRVVLRSGIFGKLVAIEGDSAKLEIADRVVIRVFKSQIAGAEAQAAQVVDSAQGR